MDNKELIRAYYEMWNDKADTLLDQDIRFRGSLDITANGIEGFKEYAQLLFTAFPNLYHAVEITIHEDDRAAVYVTYTGTHEGPLFHYQPTASAIRGPRSSISATGRSPVSTFSAT